MHRQQLKNVCVSLFKLIFNRLLLLLLIISMSFEKFFRAFSTTLYLIQLLIPPPIFVTPFAIPIDACLNGFTKCIDLLTNTKNNHNNNNEQKEILLIM